MELFFFWVIMAVVVSFVANAKGRSPGLWLLYGLVIWPIALIHAIVMTKTVEALEQEKQKQGNIRCPNCADWVYKDAKTCPHCQHDLKAKPASKPRAVEPAKHPRNTTSPEDVWQGERNLDAAKYKIFLSKKFDIQKNDLFEKYVCGDEMFATLDEALTHADKLDTEQAANQEHSAYTVVQTGSIGPEDRFAYEKFANGQVSLVHPSTGVSYRFKDMQDVQSFIDQFATETQIVIKLRQCNRIGRVSEA